MAQRRPVFARMIQVPETCPAGVGRVSHTSDIRVFGNYLLSQAHQRALGGPSSEDS
jgi:hypothetical protein